MKNLARIGALALLPLLAGCFDFVQSITVEPDGTVTFVTEVAIETDMMAVAFESSDQSDFCPTDEDTNVPDTVTTTTEQFVRDADTVCRVTAVGPIADLTEAFETGALTPAGGTDEGAPEVTLVDEGNGVFTYTVHIASQGSEDTTADDEAMMTMMAPMFEGRSLTWSLTAPRIIEVNDDSDYVTLDGNTVTLTVPAFEMISQPGIVYDLNVRFGL
jgi:hypothetical protein